MEDARRRCTYYRDIIFVTLPTILVRPPNFAARAMTCTQCATIDLVTLADDEATAPHHATFEELQACATSTACLLCKQVERKFLKIFKREGFTEPEARCLQVRYRGIRAKSFYTGEGRHGLVSIVFVATLVDDSEIDGLQVDLFVDEGQSQYLPNVQGS